VFDRLPRIFVKLAELPFAGNGRAIAGVAEVMTEGPDLRRQADTRTLADQPLKPRPSRIKPAHEHHPRRCAERRRVGIVEPHPFPRHPIQIRRRVDLTAVTPQALGTEVVRHDHDHVRAGGSRVIHRDGGQDTKEQQQGSFHHLDLETFGRIRSAGQR
jgi:hypothetical protein